MENTTNSGIPVITPSSDEEILEPSSFVGSELFSPVVSSGLGTESEDESLSSSLGEEDATNGLTAASVGEHMRQAQFNVQDWQWATNTQTPRQRTMSMRTILLPNMRPLASTVPDTLPSLYQPSQTTDEDYDEEDNATEADSIVFENQTVSAVRIFSSIPHLLGQEEAHFDALEAFQDFEDLAIIVAALQLPPEQLAQDDGPGAA